MTDAAFQVGGLFVVALLMMGLLLWIYIGSLPLAMLVVATSLVSCTWELGLLHLIGRSEEHTSELQSLMRISYAVFCLKKKKNINKLVIIKVSLNTKCNLNRT